MLIMASGQDFLFCLGVNDLTIKLSQAHSLLNIIYFKVALNLLGDPSSSSLAVLVAKQITKTNLLNNID